jgi:hypothetical protein
VTQRHIEVLKENQRRNREAVPFCDFCGRWSVSYGYKSAMSANGAIICLECAELAVELCKENGGLK